MDREKKNIEALTEANRVAFEGWQALVHRQAEILQESIKQAVGIMQGEDAGTKRMDLAAHAFQTALPYARTGRDGGQIPEGSFRHHSQRVEENLACFVPWNWRVAKLVVKSDTSVPEKRAHLG